MAAKASRNRDPRLEAAIRDELRLCGQSPLEDRLGAVSAWRPGQRAGEPARRRSGERGPLALPSAQQVGVRGVLADGVADQRLGVCDRVGLVVIAEVVVQQGEERVAVRLRQPGDLGVEDVVEDRTQRQIARGERLAPVIGDELLFDQFAKALPVGRLRPGFRARRRCRQVRGAHCPAPEPSPDRPAAARGAFRCPSGNRTCW